MKKYILILMAALVMVTATAQNNDDLLVTLPTPPKNIERLDERCNYIVDRYWKTFNPKSSFSSLKRLDKTMGQFLAFTPYATADTVHMAINALIENVAKAKPENLLTLASIVEKYCFSDTAEYLSEELYFPFVEAIATNKKAKGPTRARYMAQYNQLKNSRVDCKVENMTFTRPDGTTGNLDDIDATHVLLFFYDPDCTDCRLAKARLSADFVLGALQRNNTVAIVAIYPDEPTDEWREDAAKLPKEWIVGAKPNAEDIFTMLARPEIYYLDQDHVIKAKNLNVDNIINTFGSLYTK